MLSLRARAHVGPRRSRRCLGAAATALMATVAVAGCGGSAGRGGNASSARFSPYVDVGLSPPFDFSAAARQTSVKAFTLGFIVAGSGCQAVWGGGRGLDSAYLSAQISALRGQGGDVRVSFGGRDGNELAHSCSSASDLARAYQSVIDRYRLTKVDFDLEGPALSDTASIARRWQAMKSVQDHASRSGRLDLSLTLPAVPQGLTPAGLSALQSARRLGVRVDHLNVLAMDFGDGAAPSPGGRMADYVQQTATSVQRQASGMLAAGGWGGLTVTPMIGVNDVASEVFGLADAQRLVAFARARGLGALSMWSMTRDKRCSGGPSTTARATCSGVDQSAYAFSRALSSLG